MTEQSIQIYAASAVSIRHVDGSAPRNGDVLGNAQWGNAFSWERPGDLAITLPSAPGTTLTFEDADGILGDDPFQGSAVVDQRLTQPVTVNGVTYAPSASTLRWQSPPPVVVENEYEVTLFDAAGTAYRMVGVSVTAGYSTTVVGVTFDGPAPPPGTTLFYRQSGSTYAGQGGAMAIPAGVTCFLAGTRIATPGGPRRIESLRVGDLVCTLDGGPRPIRWIGRRQVPGRGEHAPIRIRAGTLGNDRDLLLSPHHRVALRSPTAHLLFDSPEVLVAARFLAGGEGIAPAPRAVADYLHILLDTHELVLAEGVPCETLLPGPVALDAVDPASRADLLLLWPELAERGPRAVRRDLSRREASLLAAPAEAAVALPSP